MTGRIDRRDYIVFSVFAYPALWLCFSVLGGAVKVLDATFPAAHLPSFAQHMRLDQQSAGIVAGVAGLVLVGLAFACLSFSVRRLHDIELTGWFVVVWPLFTAFWGAAMDLPDGCGAQYVWLGVLAMVPGTRGPNRYGLDPNEVRAGAAMPEVSAVSSPE